jgi:hypothetical protein
MRGARVLDVFTLTWMPPQDILVKGDRIAYVGPVGAWPGTTASIHDALDLALQYALSTYDESYLEPALRRGLPLGDSAPPLTAARARGVPVLFAT